MTKAKVKNDEDLFFITRSFYCTYLKNSKKILHKITTIAQKTNMNKKWLVGNKVLNIAREFRPAFLYCTWFQVEYIHCT